MGKSTFVKKLTMDWAELDENRLTDEQRAILKKFEFAVIIDLKKDDHVFEFDRLSAKNLCEEISINGLLQVSEYTENLRPAGMVSFIHESIQEFLAAWYITFKCLIPVGNLSEIEDRAQTLDDCRSLDNAFQFICGLSDDGAEKVSEHLKSVRIADPELYLSKSRVRLTY
ncbi:hypothetical protein AWC38_SpisGene8849 [Stylophora pistillata]|uniref:Uncharacterized protein n=1 Tax=Stylophora pistillata TaxID=50429 RepID=A0A2B4SAS9_STYPI|nr:hypothetical protein AWC38_SpisGene8849 [Stylophora pistillata]